MDGKQQQRGGGGRRGGGHGAAADYVDSLEPGYRFCPTDSELIVYYLKPLIAKQIHPRFARFYDVNIYDYHPKELAEKYKACEDKWYFMTPRVPKYANGNRPNRRTKDDGTWKASQSYTPVENSNRVVVGSKRSLAYLENHVKKTEWLMHEYTTPENEMSERVLCKIYKKETSETKKKRAIQDKNKRKNEQDKNQDEPSPIRRRISGNQLQQENNNEPQQQQVQIDTTSTLTGSHQPFPAQSLTGEESGFGNIQVEDDGFDELLSLLYKDDADEDEIDKQNSKQSMEVPDEADNDEDEIAKLMEMFDDEIDKNSKQSMKEPQVDNEGDEFGEKMTLFDAEKHKDKLMAQFEEDDVEDEIDKNSKKNMEVADHDVANDQLDKAMVRSDDKDVSRISFSRSDCVEVFSLDDLFSR